MPDIFFAARSWAGCITNMSGFDLRQAQRVGTSGCPAMATDLERRRGIAIPVELLLNVTSPHRL
jgi:hypothetical protein